MKVRVLAPALFFIPAAVFGAGDVTFYRDVLPVLQKNCQGCHRPGEAAPMSFLTYKDVRPWTKSSPQAISVKKMPPWPADPHFAKFKKDRSLPQKDIDRMSAWIAAGAPEGKWSDPPKPMKFT